MERPVLTNFVLKETAVLLLDILRQVGIEHKRRYLCVRQLRAVFYLYELSLYRLWRCSLDDRQHDGVEFRRSDMHLAVEIYLLGGLENLKDALLGYRRCKDNREVGKWCHTVVDGILERIDGFLALVLNKVPLIHDDDKTLVVLLYKLEDIHVLSLYTAGGINHEYAHVAVLNGADGTHDTVELQVLGDLVLTADTGGIDEIEVESEFRITGVDTVAGCASNLGDDVAVLANKGVDDARLTGIRTAYDSKAGNVLLEAFLRNILEFSEDKVEQVAGASARSS